MNIQIKSIRQQILASLVKNGEQTVDNMIDQINGFTRKQICDNIAQFVVEKLATRRKDDLSGMPAYKITDLGKSRIKSDAAPVKQSLTTQLVNSTVLVEQPVAEHIQSFAEVAELRKLVEAGAAENLRLRGDLASAQDEISTRVSECNRLKTYCDELLDTNSGLATSAFNTAEHEQQVTVEQFLIRVPKRRPLVVKSFEKARQQAMSAAKSVGKVEVFAMVAVGHAVRGSVWNQKQA